MSDETGAIYHIAGARFLRDPLDPIARFFASCRAEFRDHSGGEFGLAS